MTLCLYQSTLEQLEWLAVLFGYEIAVFAATRATRDMRLHISAIKHCLFIIADAGI